MLKEINRRYKPLHLRNRVPIIRNCDMILELMEAHFEGLAAVRKKGHRTIPSAGSGFALERLGFCDYLLISASSPESFVVVRTTGLVGLVWFHLGFPEILDMGEKMLIYFVVLLADQMEWFWEYLCGPI